MRNRVRFATVVGLEPGPLGSTLAHYRNLGIESLSVHVHRSHSLDPIVELVRPIVESQGAILHGVTTGAWLNRTNRQILDKMRHQWPSDWFILADADELQLYPDDLFSLLSFCESHDYDCLAGCMLDRVAADGGFPPLDPARSLDDQFPLGGFLVHPVYRGCPLKIVAVRGAAIPLHFGNHGTDTGRPLPDVLVQVHHFKWDAAVLARMQHRKRVWTAHREPWRCEATRLENYLRRNKGKFDLEDPRFLVADCRPEYPYWEAIHEIVADLPRYAARWGYQDRGVSSTIAVGGRTKFNIYSAVGDCTTTNPFPDHGESQGTVSRS